MSNEVKRWEPCLKDSPAGTFVTTKETKRVRNVYVRIEDHDRLMKEKDAEIERLKTYVQHRVDCICRAGVLQYSEECDCGLIEAMNKLEDLKKL